MEDLGMLLILELHTKHVLLVLCRYSNREPLANTVMINLFLENKDKLVFYFFKTLHKPNIIKHVV